MDPGQYGRHRTVTYIIPDTGAFAGLGHGIYDIDTGKLVPLRRGTVNDVIISGIKKGRAGAPVNYRDILVPKSSAH